MKYIFLLFILGFSLVMVSCQKGSEPEPASLRQADTLALQLSGSWQSQMIYKNSYTNDVLTDQESSASVETYNFTKDGGFHLIQDIFSIKGKWKLTTSGDQLLVTTESGEVLQWDIQILSDEQLVLYSSQTLMIGETAQRLETWVDCTRVIP